VCGSIVDGNKGRGADNGIFELLHGAGVLVFPNKSDSFVGEVDERVGYRRIVADPDAHVASKA